MENQKLEELKFETQYIEDEKSSPLLIIRKKELEISRNILEAKKKAEQIVADARRKATELKEESREKGLEEGKLIYEEEMEKAKNEAQKIRSTSKKEIGFLENKCKENMPKALKKIIEIIIP